MIHPKMSNEVESISPVGPETGGGGGGGRAEDVDSDVRDAPSHSSTGSVVERDGRKGTSIYDIHSRMYVSGLPVLHLRGKGTSIRREFANIIHGGPLKPEGRERGRGRRKTDFCRT